MSAAAAALIPAHAHARALAPARAHARDRVGFRRLVRATGARS